MTTAATTQARPIPDYSRPAARGGWVTQTIALFVDAYRELNHKKLFWVVLILSVLVVAGFAIPGINERGITLFKLEFNSAFNSKFISPGDFYKMLYIVFAIPIWLAWIATILAIVSTASIFPDMLTGGSIDLYLAKPISRLRLFLTKYITGLTFVTLQVALFSLTAFVVIGIRGGAWEPGLFLAVPVVVLFFSYLFAVSVLLGVLTRSTIAAMLLTLLFWVFIWAAHTADQTIHLFKIAGEVKQERLATVIARNDADLARYQEQLRQQTGAAQPAAAPGATQPSTTQPATGLAGLIKNIEFQRDATLKEKSSSAGTLRNLQTAARVSDALSAALPKTGQTINLLRRSLVRAAHLPGHYDESDDQPNGNGRGRRGRGNRDDADFDPGDPEVARRLQSRLESESPSYILGTSVAFEAVVLVLAAWVFCRRDY
jgi:ABC-type transport system involved in multi-copper enzyme maturation permease subunit